MKTGDLIRAMAEDSATRTRPLAVSIAAALAVGGLAAGLLFAIALGARPDIADALQTWRFVAKVAIVFICFVVALWATALLAHPDASLRRVLPVLAIPPVLLALAIGCELASSAPETWVPRAVGSNSRLCLASITLLSVAPLGTLLLVLRAGAPRSPASLGAAAGLLAAGLAATLYAIHCVDDSPLFVTLWYTPAIATVALAGMLIGACVLRW
jgi:hypothetical protein